MHEENLFHDNKKEPFVTKYCPHKKLSNIYYFSRNKHFVNRTLNAIFLNTNDINFIFDNKAPKSFLAKFSAIFKTFSRVPTDIGNLWLECRDTVWTVKAQLIHVRNSKQ